MSKIQDLKGTHNLPCKGERQGRVVSDVKDTRFERNSQLSYWSGKAYLSCFWCQRYKIWKELTTTGYVIKKYNWLFLMSKIQDLKGTHNLSEYVIYWLNVVSDVKDTRFERNSQLKNINQNKPLSCFWCQRYKIWKELTTSCRC